MKKAILLCFVLTILKTPAFTQSQSTKPRLRILTWNIYMLPGLVPLPGRGKRAEKIVDTLSKSNNDIIVFQEVFHKKTYEYLKNKLAPSYPFMYGPFNPSKNGLSTNSGVCVISKIPLKILDAIEFEAKSGIDKIAKKGAVLLSGKFHSTPFQILGTHMQADYKPAIRRLQFNQMKTQLLEKHQQKGVVQILTGDMNTEWKFNEDYKEMLDILKAEDGEILSEQKETYCGFTNKYVAKTWGNKKTNFDYILIRNNDSKTLSVKRWTCVMKTNWKKKHNDLSDHYGLSAEIVF